MVLSSTYSRIKQENIMNKIRWLTLIFITLTSHLAYADDTDAKTKNRLHYLPRELEIELALAAGPKHIRQEAAVYVFGKSGYEKVRDGKNGFTCFVNRDGHQHGEPVLRPTCWDREGSATIVPVMLRVGELLAQGKSAADIKKDIDSGFNSKRFVSPKKAGIAYMLKGDLAFDEKKQQVSDTLFPAHYMLYAPGVSNDDLGVTDEAFRNDHSLPFIYDGYSGGTHTAYIIVPASSAAGHAHH